MPSGGCFGPSRLVIDLAIGEMLLVLLLFLVVLNSVQGHRPDTKCERDHEQRRVLVHLQVG